MMAVRGREQSLDPAVRERLLTVARDAFATQGYERASLNAMLAAADVGKGSFYYFFVDKEDLFATLIEDGIARIEAAVGECALPDRADHFWPEVEAILARCADAAVAEPRFLELLRALQPLRRTRSARLSAVLDRSRALSRSLLERGVALGTIRKDLSVDTLLALVEAVDVVIDDEFHREFHRHPAPSSEALAIHRDRVVDLVRRLVASAEER